MKMKPEEGQVKDSDGEKRRQAAFTKFYTSLCVVRSQMPKCYYACSGQDLHNDADDEVGMMLYQGAGRRDEA